MVFKLTLLIVILIQSLQSRDRFFSKTKNEIDFDDEFQALEPSVFDSYYHMTDLESYPNVCDEYASEKCAKLWFDKINEISIRNRNRFANIHFKYSTDINKKNLELKKRFQRIGSKIGLKLKRKSKKFHWKSFKSPELRRKFRLITASIRNENESLVHELIHINNDISYIYNNAKPCFNKCLEVGESGIIKLFKTEKDYEKLAGYWTAWRNVTGQKIKKLFLRRMQLENIGSRENGHEDAATYGLSFDFEDDDFKSTALKLYGAILPLYKELHGYVRYCLNKFYPGKFDKSGPIPAHIFGNVWAQQWTNIFPIIRDCGQKLSAENYQDEATENLSKMPVEQMFTIAEEFYESIGMFKMTDEFWERSMLSKPQDKVVNCHGSAHDFSNGVDFRIKMCTEKNMVDFTTIHHEMGHIEYYMAYSHLPTIFRGSANSGFHEAIGDTIALAVKTPEHLHKIGLISRVPDSKGFDIDYLMATALEKVAFLPFALSMDSYIWGLYNGSVPLSEVNKHWWDLRYRYQGLMPPVKRTEDDFDPGSKYHISFGVSYIRYFVSFLIQFQFYESMCNISGYKGPLHRCNFYQSKEAGLKLMEMLSKGKSQNWRETMKILTGATEIKSESLLKFFDPLYKWLKFTNKKLNIPIGW